MLSFLVPSAVVAIITSSFDRLDGCTPSDFPIYPGDADMGCRVVRQTFDQQWQITGFYESRLSEGNWAITATYPSVGRIDFNHFRGKKLSGSIWHARSSICMYFNKHAASGSAPRQLPWPFMSNGGGVCDGAIPKTVLVS